MTKHLQNIGLLLFLVGFGIFIASFFIGGFQLKDDLSDQLSENEMAFAQASSEE